MVGKPRAKPAARSRSYIPTSLRGANGSRECAPDDRLRDEAIYSYFLRCYMDCFAEPVIGRRFVPTRWLAMTENLTSRHAREGAETKR
jgi:hypothetical protein